MKALYMNINEPSSLALNEIISKTGESKTKIIERLLLKEASSMLNNNMEQLARNVELSAQALIREIKTNGKHKISKR